MAQIAEVIGGVSVLAAVIFGIAQLRQYRQQRRDAAAIELMRSLQDAEFTQAFRLIDTLPDDIPAKDLRAKGAEFEGAAYTLCAKFETMGFLVYRGSIPFELLSELVGGATVGVWRKLLPWAEESRSRQGQEMRWEWFQWLAERLEENGRTGQSPAHELHRDWEPAG